MEGMTLEDLQNRHDADDESIASSDAGDIGALEDLDIFKRRDEQKEASSTQLSEAEIGRGLLSQVHSGCICIFYYKRNCSSNYNVFKHSIFVSAQACASSLSRMRDSRTA